METTISKPADKESFTTVESVRSIDIPALLARATQIGGKAAAIEYGITPNAIGGYRRAERIRLGLIKSRARSVGTSRAVPTTVSTTEPTMDNNTPSVLTEERINDAATWPLEKSILEEKVDQLTHQLHKLKAVIRELIKAF